MLDSWFISIDILVIIVVLVLLILLSFKFNKKLLTTLIISLYPTLLIFLNLPFIRLKDDISKSVFFIILYIVVAIAIKKNIRGMKCHRFNRKIIDYGALSISYLMSFFAVYIYIIPSLSAIYNFSDRVIALFDFVPYGIWLILPLGVLFFTNKKNLE